MVEPLRMSSEVLSTINESIVPSRFHVPDAVILFADGGALGHLRESRVKENAPLLSNLYSRLLFADAQVPTSS